MDFWDMPQDASISGDRCPRCMGDWQFRGKGKKKKIAEEKLPLGGWTGVGQLHAPVMQFICNCTDPGWVYSSSPRCRASGPSLAPSISCPSSDSLRAWSKSSLPQKQHCRWSRLWKTDLPFAMLQHANKRRPTYTHKNVLSSMQAHLVISVLDCLACPPCPALHKPKLFECVESKTGPHLQFSCFSQCSAGCKEGGSGRSEAERKLDSAASNQLTQDQYCTYYVFSSELNIKIMSLNMQTWVKFHY